jgi:hypothetical protein
MATYDAMKATPIRGMIAPMMAAHEEQLEETPPVRCRTGGADAQELSATARAHVSADSFR